MDHKIGLCNGTFLIVFRLAWNVIVANIATDDSIERLFDIPCIPLVTDPDENGLPFKLICEKFPVNLDFSLTINKSQVQTISYVGLYLVFEFILHQEIAMYFLL